MSEPRGDAKEAADMLRVLADVVEAGDALDFAAVAKVERKSMGISFLPGPVLTYSLIVIRRDTREPGDDLWAPITRDAAVLSLEKMLREGE